MSITEMRARSRWQPDFASLARNRMAMARSAAGLAPSAFAVLLAELVGRPVTAGHVRSWETTGTPPGDVLIAADTVAPGAPRVALPLLAAVPPAFPAEALAGDWVTTYEFSHAGKPHFHADIARVTAESEGRIRAVNHPPEPRSQGRRQAFRNEIEAALVGRHLVGEWQNTSDHRYCGGLQLAVLPGETVMEGLYTGVASDVEVSRGDWKWVRLETGADLAGIVLRDPAEIHRRVMDHAQIDVPLMLADIGEEA